MWALHAAGEKQGHGHTEASTSLLALESPTGNFVLSSSLDGSVKAWIGSNVMCMASEMHGEGVVNMAYPKGNSLLLLGLQEGIIMCRSVLQTPTNYTRIFIFVCPHATLYHWTRGACQIHRSRTRQHLLHGWTRWQTPPFPNHRRLGLVDDSRLD
eukprot:scaffold115896_cov32-Attheya_sp.AAC.2